MVATNEEMRQLVEALVKVETLMHEAVMAHPEAVRWSTAAWDKDQHPRSLLHDVQVFDESGKVIFLGAAAEFIDERL